MKDYRITLWIDFKKEFVVNEEINEQQEKFINDLGTLDWHFKPSSKLVRCLPIIPRVGEELSCQPLFEAIKLDSWDYEVLIDSNVVITGVQYHIEDDKIDDTYTLVFLDCYPKRWHLLEVGESVGDV